MNDVEPVQRRESIQETNAQGDDLYRGKMLAAVELVLQGRAVEIMDGKIQEIASRQGQYIGEIMRMHPL